MLKKAIRLLTGALVYEAFHHASHPGQPHVPDELVDSAPAIRTQAEPCTDVQFFPASENV